MVIGMINSSSEIRYRNNVPFNAQSAPLSQGGQATYVPSMQGVQDNYVSNRVKKIEYDWLTFPIGVGAWYGICKGMDYFNNKLCDREYMDTPFGKIGAWGDKVSNNYFNSSFAKSDFGQGLHKFLGDTKNFINDKIIGKSKVLTAMKTTPTSPENKMAVMQAKGLLGWHSGEVDSLIPSFLEKSEVAEQLERYGMKKDDVKTLKQDLKGLSKKERLARLEAEEFKLFGVHSEDALKAAKIKAMGFKSVDDYTRIAGTKGEKFLENAEEVFEALKNADPKMKINRWVGEGRFSWVTKLMGREISFRELANKYRVVGIQNPHTTKLGRGLSQSLGWLLEGATNRFAGGKFAAILQAGILAQMVVSALKADGPGEKVKTFIERGVNDFSYVFAAPLAIMAMHRVGGMKYAGMTPEQVANYRAQLKIFNAKADAKAFANKTEYKNAKKQLKELLKGDTKNGFFTRMCKKIGQAINIGNEKINPYLSKSDNNLNFFRKMGKWTKNAAGYPVRLGLAMFVLMPFISSTVTKTSNAIFGKPKNSVLDEDAEDDATKNENVNAQLAQLRQDAIARQQASQQHQMMAQQYQNAPRMDMLTKYKQGQNGRTVVNNTTNINNNYVGAQQPTQQKDPEPIRTYIPSPIGVQVAMPNIDPANAALQRSMNAEQEALRMLAM